MPSDYTRLMRTLRYAHDSTTAAKRILTVEQNRRAQGTNSTREICEISAQAHLILGDVPDAIRLYYEAAEIAGLGSPKHIKLLHTMTDAFAINQLVPDGIAFLDQVPKWNSDDEDTLSFVLSLYRELYLYQYSSRSHHMALPSPPPLPPSSHAPIKYLTDKPLPPHTNHALKTLSTLENHADRTELLCVFSKTVAGMLIWADRTEIVSPLIRSLVESGNIDEAARVLHLVKQRGMELDMERIRQHLLRSYGTCVDKKQLEQSITRWDALTIQQPGTASSSALPSSSPSSLTNNISQVQQVYSDLVQRCIREGDLNGAMGTAQFMSKHNWRLQGVDPHQLTSLTVNYGQSTDYPAYLDVRYIFGGSLDPDLHTYRRLIYAACRRSDLFTALTLFKQIQARHKHWKLDTSFYNAIISTAAATKQVRLAERTFASMLENGVRPDYFSFHGLLNGYARTGDLEAAILMPQHMVDLKLNPTTRTFNLVMKAYLGSRMDLSTSQKLLKVMQGSGEKAVPPDLVTFNQLLEGYRRVGNTTWFDAYFDRYFGNEDPPAVAAAASGADHSRNASDLAEPYSSHQRGDDNEDIDYAAEPTYKEQRRGSGSLADHSTIPPKEIRPEKTDDRTLLIQLKHSLLLPSVDLTTVQELWRAIEPRMQPVSSASLPTAPSWDSVGEDQYPEEFSRNPPPSSAASDGSHVVPPTYVPFERYLAPVWKPATDQDYFRFSTITLFRSAFQSRGYLGGVKQMDRLLAALFPNHPLGQEVQRKKTIRWIRRVIKNSDGDRSSSSSKSQSGDKDKDKSMDKGKSKGKGRQER
ncbi:hypothetical protein BGZ98_009911 [Dissophora globulifera]|nr:hypothetical protein BGZ98_009911 [Dissophora globulifera]